MEFLGIFVISSPGLFFFPGTFSNGAYIKKPIDSVFAGNYPHLTKTITISGHKQNGELNLKNQSGNDGTTYAVHHSEDIVWNCTVHAISIMKFKKNFLKGNPFKNKPASLSKKNGQAK